ncbi:MULTISPECIES: GNAT family N-acetyltransferase [Streptomyces]|uniref:GNAT family N-acetyltransferase n=1 Tax=Streptomyces lycii TaxID=2654337 RepID=A0ABQ7FFS9_9ACTN|nr:MULTISPECIES: GNAT family N-acetyltransferase [Streptomyces]KAF4406828.1 GNAT family N-acetyltransferase [Streptomyces lycii]PGH50685.1 GNAT family N-acetyltransferase [Streptomyces sp. Ru87]
MVQLRAMTPDDWPRWRDARLAALADAPHAFKSRLADWHRGGEEQWRARLEAPGTYNVLALLDGDRTAGMASGVPGDGGVCELRSVWVGPDARGRGVADRLVGAVEEWALRSGAAALRLTVIPGNEPAAALYRRHGFAATGELGAVLRDGVTRELVMAKRLGRAGP